MENRGVVGVWEGCVAAQGYPRDPAQYLALILRAFPRGAEGARGLNQTVGQDEERRTILRDKFHMIDICACLFLSSM